MSQSWNDIVPQQKKSSPLAYLRYAGRRLCLGLLRYSVLWH